MADTPTTPVTPKLPDYTDASEEQMRGECRYLAGRLADAESALRVAQARCNVARTRYDHAHAALIDKTWERARTNTESFKSKFTSAPPAPEAL